MATTTYSLKLLISIPQGEKFVDLSVEDSTGRMFLVTDKNLYEIIATTV